MDTLTDECIIRFGIYLAENEKAPATIEKYCRDVKKLSEFLNGRELCKRNVIEFKEKIFEEYAAVSVNSIISSINSYFEFSGKRVLKVKTVRIQRRIFADENKMLDRESYEKMLYESKKEGKERLFLLIQTLGSTGMRVSELKFVTVEAVNSGYASIRCKGKRRTVFLPEPLCRRLLHYIKKNKIKCGPVFITRNGNPLDRSNIWSEMKRLGAKANVETSKVFPHNLRHLFARTYYKTRKDIVRLADILGHSSINTTRIYTAETADLRRREIQQLGLLLC